MAGYQLQSLSDAIEEGRRLTLEVTLSDLELALTFLDTARASQNPATIARCHRNALTAFMKARRQQVKPATGEQRARIEQLYESIRVQLARYYGWTEGAPTRGTQPGEPGEPDAASGGAAS